MDESYFRTQANSTRHITFRERAGIGRALLARLCLRFPRRGGNYINGGSAGLGYVNSNNPRSNGNWNYGARPRS